MPLDTKASEPVKARNQKWRELQWAITWCEGKKWVSSQWADMPSWEYSSGHETCDLLPYAVVGFAKAIIKRDLEEGSDE